MNAPTHPPDNAPLRISGFAGSLRKASLNKALLRAARELAPAGMELEILDLADVPLYNADVEAIAVPEPVERLRAAVRASDGLLLATPEYNFGVPAVMKNALDWLSRPPRPSALDGLPAAIMGASPGGFGTVRGQTQLRQTLLGTNTLAMLQPEMFVSRANEKFAGGGRLTDESTRENLSKFLAAFAAWIRRVRG